MRSDNLYATDSLPSRSSSDSVDGGPTGKGEGAFVLAHDDAAVLPFSHGPMNCPGRGLALLELRAVMYAFPVRRFRTHLAPAWNPARYDREYRDCFSATRPDSDLLVPLERSE